MLKKCINLVILCCFALNGCIATTNLNSLFGNSIEKPQLTFSDAVPDVSSETIFQKSETTNLPIHKKEATVKTAEQLVMLDKKGAVLEEKLTPTKKQRVSEVIDQANLNSRRQPNPQTYHNAVATYTYEENIMYSIFTSPGHITDVRFEQGETILSIAAGDTKNFLIEHAVAVDSPHLLIKPLHSGLSTNLTVLTDKRTYWFYLRSWKKTFMAGCQFHYPKDELKRKEIIERQSIGKFQMDDLNFDYIIETDCSDCQKPLSVFADEKNGKLHIIMSQIIRHSSLPALFALDNEGNTTMINYRFVDGKKFVLDTLHTNTMLMLQYGGKNRCVYIYKSGIKPKRTFGSFLNNLLGNKFSKSEPGTHASEK